MARKAKRGIWAAPGGAPSMQGYWARSEGRPRDPPAFNPGHLDNEWISQWLKGWDDCDKHKLEIG